MTEKQASNPDSSTATPLRKQVHRLGQGALVLLVSSAVLYLFLCVATWSASDPGWSQSSSDHIVIQNLGGRIGAWIADVLHQLFGYGAWLVPLSLVTIMWLTLSGSLAQARQYHGWIPTLRLVGLVSLIVGVSGMLYMRLPGRDVALAGGGLGMLVGKTLQNTFGMVGCNLFLLLLVLTSITLVTGLSWVWLMEKIGQAVLSIGSRLGGGITAWRQRKQQRAKQNKRRAPGWDMPTVDEMTNTVPAALTLPGRIEPRVSVAHIPPDTDASQGQNQSQGRKSRWMRREPILNPEPSPTPTPPAPAAEPKIERASVPAAELLDTPPAPPSGYDAPTLDTLSRQIEAKLREFRIESQVVGTHPGPVVTLFEIEPAPGVKVSQITALEKDIARSLSVNSVRILDVIPGKSVIGMEIPNTQREMISLAPLLHSEDYAASSSLLSLALGKGTRGQPVIVDLARMPHLLMAGTTGSGKSVAVNAMVLSLLFKATPDELRLLMIDPKMLELNVYEGIAHLLAPVITDMNKAATGLGWCVDEMERRYKLMSATGVRNLNSFNKKVNDAWADGQPLLDPLFVADSYHGTAPQPLAPMPYIVIVVDELADLMMVAGKKVEELIARLAQKARAAGIHLILATQRPSVDVITGLIKANIPTRIAFQVSSKVDSRIILDQSGAEALLGQGDMLYLQPGTALPERVHGAFVSDDEVDRVVAHLKKAAGPNYIPGLLDDPAPEAAEGSANSNSQHEASDALYEQAVQIVIESRRPSVANIQRRLKIGPARALRLIEAMEQDGIVSRPDEHSGERSVLASPPVRERFLSNK